MEGGLTGSLLNSAQTTIMSEISAGLPAAGIVFASLAGLAVAVKLFKKVTGARA